jgi:sarcosine oxidase subunit alpha
MVLDDGTTSRLSDTHYFMTTTTAQAGRVMQHLEWLLQVVWPDLRVTVTSSTDQWAAMSIAGKDSRAILQAAFPTFDFSADSLPHMGLVQGECQGEFGSFSLRFIRLSFSGELAYEVYAPTHYGQAVWEHVLAVGKPLGLQVYGLEALASLRIEKGHVVGSELDGRTTAADVGLGKMASKLKPYWGGALAQSPELVRDNRATLVGLEELEEGQPPTNGSILFFEGDTLKGVGRGHISSYCFSKVYGKSIALGLLEGGLKHLNQTIVATSPVHGRTYKLKVVSPVFYDAEGSRYTDPKPLERSEPLVPIGQGTTPH